MSFYIGPPRPVGKCRTCGKDVERKEVPDSNKPKGKRYANICPICGEITDSKKINHYLYPQ